MHTAMEGGQGRPCAARCLAVALLAALVVAAAGSTALDVRVDTGTGVLTVTVDGDAWILGGGPHIEVLGLASALQIAGSTTATGSDKYGAYTRTSIAWAEPGGDGQATIITNVTNYAERELVLLSQEWPRGWQSVPPAPPSPPPPDVCSHVMKDTDQTGGDLIQTVTANQTQCCAQCLANGNCNGYALNPATNDCYLIAGYSGLKASTDRSFGAVRPPASTAHLVAGFPTFNLSSEVAGLRYLSWGGCQVAAPVVGAWDGSPSFNGISSGSPVVWHNQDGRSVVVSPFSSYFVSGQATRQDTKTLDCGLRSSLLSIPEGYNFTTVMVGGQGINATMSEWGDLLLGVKGKARTDPYKDFVLSHLGYWTDNGAYYYHNSGEFTNEEAALKAVKADLLAQDIPVHYFQWDDWWMEGNGDTGGITSWTPKPEVFPSGFTNWLNTSLSLYAPMYAAENDWVANYPGWKNDTKSKTSHTAIPLNPHFYTDLFKNGTRIGMKMFEQDFLCTYNGDTSTTSSDVYSGAQWMDGMDAGARANAGVTLQFCMMNPNEALLSTHIHAMTNGRATGDNCRGAPIDLNPLGQTSLLYSSLGFFASRDNVWTSAPTDQQKGCNRFCYEPNPLGDNAAALLAGGPYGFSDAIGHYRRAVIMQTCRADGVLLRPRLPLTSLDFTFTRVDLIDQSPRIWAAHDDHGPWRWSYIMGVNTAASTSMLPKELQAATVPAAMVVYQQVIEQANVTKVSAFSEGSPLTLPATPPTKVGPGTSHWVAAPVLPGGIALLGEVSKFAPMSSRRFSGLDAAAAGFSVNVVGAPDEVVVVSVVSAQLEVHTVKCHMPGQASCTKGNLGDFDCTQVLKCSSAELACSCA